MDDWIDYYDSTHTIYVSKLHRDVHFRVIANDILAYVPAPDAVVLDYSCGEALSAPQVAAACGQLILAEPAPGVRGRLSARFAPNPKIVVRSLDDLAQLPNSSVDLAVMNSVAQYMTRDELDRAFALMRRVLKPGGKLVLGDILRPEVGAVTDVIALLKLAAGNGFLTDALWGLARTALSDYWQLRKRIGLQRYAEAGMISMLKTAGFAATRAPANIGYNPARMTFVATRRD
ncbi:MAG: class I SAM-dependent methyltransferase [Pseudomonadota bacterium]